MLYIVLYIVHYSTDRLTDSFSICNVNVNRLELLVLNNIHPWPLSTWPPIWKLAL